MSSTNPPKTELPTLDSKWNENCLVRVKAQVMTRDDSTGMWVPMSGGGMSFVSLHRFINTSRTNDDDADDVAYVILGQRIADKSTALNCELLNDLEYTSVNPTFHHWTTNRKRFGLTFQTSSDATAFQRSIHAIPPLLTDDDDHSDKKKHMQVQQQQGPVDSKTQLHITAEEVLTVLQQQHVQISRQKGTTVVVESSDETTRSSSPSSLSPIPSSVSHLRPPTKDSSYLHHSTNDRTQQDHRTISQGRPPPPHPHPHPQSITPRIQIIHPHSTTSPMTDQSEIVVPPKTPPRFPIESTSSPPPPPPDPSSTGVTLGDYGYYVDVVSPNTGRDRTADIWLEGNTTTKDLGRKVGLLAIPSDEADDLIYFSGSYVHFARNADPETHDYCYPSIDAFGTSPYGTGPPVGPPRSTGDPRSSAHLSTSVPLPLPIKTRRKWLKRKKSLPAKSKSSTSKSSTPKSSTSKSSTLKSSSSKSSMSKSSTSKSNTMRHRAQGPKVRCVYCDEFFSWDENRAGSCRDAPDRVLACIKAATCVCCQEAVAYHCGGNDGDDSEDCDRLDCGGGSRGRGSGRRRAVLVLICLVVPCLWCYLPLRTCHRLGVACGCCGPRHKAA